MNRMIEPGRRILIYTDDPDEGGVAVYNHALALGLRRHGYHVSCAQTKVDGPAVAERSAHGIEHAWIPFHTRNDLQRNFDGFAEAEAIITATRPDLIVFTNCSTSSHHAAKTVALHKQVPFMIVEHFVVPYATFTPEVAWVLQHQREFYRHARAVVAVSGDNLRWLRSHYGLDPRKGEVIHNGRPRVFFDPPSPDSRRSIRGALGIPDDAIVCLTTARLVPVKGFEHQLAAMELLKHSPSWERLHFLWAGSGPSRDALTAAAAAAGIADRIHFAGQRDDVPALLDASDMFVLTSHHEGMPLSIMEAMAKGLPVAASAVSGIPEELGGTGCLLPDPNVDPEGTRRVLADTLRRWTEDDSVRRAVGAAARLRAEQLFTEERMIVDTANVVARCLLPAGDYASPGLEVIRLDRHFPHLSKAPPGALAWEYLRDDIPHTFYIDGRIPGTGFLNRDEAILLYNIARLFRGQRGLEVGCWLGWSAAHIAAAGVVLDVVDPVLTNESVRGSVTASLESAGLASLVTLHADASPQAIDTIGRSGRRWSFFFIDGNHDAPYPLFDTATAIDYAEPNAAIVLHDLASPEVAQALEYLACRGWQTRIYHTTQIMGIAWRGDVVPPQHREDPSVAWTIPRHLRAFAPAACDAGCKGDQRRQ